MKAVDRRRPRSDKNCPRQCGERARQRLIAAGLQVFSVTDYKAASIREITRRAGTNVAAIRYHFGSKLDLFKAVAHYVVEEIKDPNLLLPHSYATLDAKAAGQELIDTMQRFVYLALQPAMEKFSRFIFQQFFEGGLGFQILYREILSYRITKTAVLLGIINHRPPEDPIVQAQALALIGEVTIFRIVKPLVLKRFSWRNYDAAALQLIESVIRARVQEIIKLAKPRSRNR